jgi:HD-GYP domain-containing protein (c-di-GMP phosphodiesterase class II)
MTESLMRALAASIDARDGLTAGHSARVAHYSVGIARTLGQDVAAQYAIYYAALLHDYGKIGIDDAVLKKPGRLTPDEFDHIKLHPKFTYDILSKIEFPPELAALPMMAASHHERWDGTGYPWGLKEDATPLAGRIIAVADVYDSLTRKRHYRDPMPLDEVMSYLEEGRASHFDPTCLDAFFAYHREELNAKERRRLEKRERGLTDEPTGGLDGLSQTGPDAETAGGGLAETDPEGARAAETDPVDDSYFDSSDELGEVTVRVEGS